jgi:phenol 2-monooxygenase
LRGLSPPRLLETYSAERRAIAQELLDFDREWAAMFSAKPKAADDVDGAGVDPNEFRKYFIRKGRFTAGTETRYRPSLIIGDPKHQNLATGFTIGMRFHSAPVVRLADAKRVHLGQAVKADGRWRLFAFADGQNLTSPSARILRLCEFLAISPDSPVKRYTPRGADIDAVIDVRVVFQQGHRELKLEDMPSFLLPRKGRYGLLDYEKIFCADLRDGADVFSIRGIDTTHGCIVLARPDGYVAHILPIDAHAELSHFFEGFLIPQI